MLVVDLWTNEAVRTDDVRATFCERVLAQLRKGRKVVVCGEEVVEGTLDSVLDEFCEEESDFRDACEHLRVMADPGEVPPGTDPWSDDEVFESEDWRAEVANGDTRLGYWGWVAHRREGGGVMTLFLVTYVAHGTELTFTLEDPQEDGIPAERKALDYYATALSSPVEVGAWCRVLRDGREWLDTR